MVRESTSSSAMPPAVTSAFLKPRGAGEGNRQAFDGANEEVSFNFAEGRGLAVLSQAGLFQGEFGQTARQ